MSIGMPGEKLMERGRQFLAAVGVDLSKKLPDGTLKEMAAALDVPFGTAGAVVSHIRAEQGIRCLYTKRRRKRPGQPPKSVPRETAREEIRRQVWQEYREALRRFSPAELYWDLSCGNSEESRSAIVAELQSRHLPTACPPDIKPRRRERP